MKPVGEFIELAERVVHDGQTELVSLVDCLEVVGAPADHNIAVSVLRGP